MGSLTFVCVYKPGNGFFDEYVYRLQESVRRFCPVANRFVCVTDQKLKGVDTLPLPPGLSGWWNKLAMFRYRFAGRVFYTDLDTMFQSDFSDIASDPVPFGCGTNWKGGRTDVISSAYMSWDGRDDYGYLFDEFDRKYIEQYEKRWERWGDQGWIQDRLRVTPTSLFAKYPGRFAHYKTEMKRAGRIPREASVVCFSGRPRPHQVNWKLP